MTHRYPNAILASAALHGTLIATLLLLTYAVQRETVPPSIIFTVGDSFPSASTQAETPANASLRLPAGSHLALSPAAPIAAAEPESAVSPKLSSPNPSRAEPGALPSARTPVASRSTPISRPITKAQFDTEHPVRATAPLSAPAKIRKIDVATLQPTAPLHDETAPTRPRHAAAQRDAVGEGISDWEAALRKQLRENLHPPAEASAELTVVITLRALADGSLTDAKIAGSSGNPDFDAAALDAIARTRMPARPDGQSLLLSVPFRLRREN